MTANIDETTVVGAGTDRGYEDKKLNDTDTNQNIFLFIILGMLMQVNLTFERLKKRLLEEEIMGSQSNFENPHSYS